MRYKKSSVLSVLALVFSWIALVFIETSYLLILLSLLYTSILLYSKMKRDVSWTYFGFEISIGVFALALFNITQHILLDVLPGFNISFSVLLGSLIVISFIASSLLLTAAWYYNILSVYHILLVLMLLVVGVGASNIYNNYTAHQQYLSIETDTSMLQYPWEHVNVEIDSAVIMQDDGSIALADEDFSNMTVWLCDETLFCQSSNESVVEAAQRFEGSTARVPYKIEGGSQTLFFQTSYDTDFVMRALTHNFSASETLRFETRPVKDLYEPTFIDMVFNPANIGNNEEVFNSLTSEVVKLPILLNYLSYERLFDNISEHERITIVGQEYLQLHGTTPSSFSVVYGQEHYPSRLNTRLQQIKDSMQQVELRSRYEMVYQDVFDDLINAIEDINNSDKEKAIITTIFVSQMNSQPNIKEFIIETRQPKLCKILTVEHLREDCMEEIQI